MAFHLPGRRALIVGDAVIGVPAGALSTYPEDKIDDQAALRRTTVQLAALDFDALLLCDGEAFLAGGRDALAAFAAGTS